MRPTSRAFRLGGFLVAAVLLFASVLTLTGPSTRPAHEDPGRPSYSTHDVAFLPGYACEAPSAPTSVPTAVAFTLPSTVFTGGTATQFAAFNPVLGVHASSLACKSSSTFANRALNRYRRQVYGLSSRSNRYLQPRSDGPVVIPLS